eukprot:11160556-Alexandrium_andersonii.AAC.1
MHRSGHGRMMTFGGACGGGGSWSWSTKLSGSLQPETERCCGVRGGPDSADALKRSLKPLRNPRLAMDHPSPPNA